MPNRIFIVEDHPLMQRMLCEFVEKLPGVEVCGTARTAEEALGALAQVEADLALVDVSLPGMNGIDLVAELRARSAPDARPLACLMVSGHTETIYVERALAAGACGYVMKGDPTALAASIREALDKDAPAYVGERPNP